jgi:hypothetical protein
LGHLEVDMDWIASAMLADIMGKAASVWLLFVGIVLTLLVRDLGVLLAGGVVVSLLRPTPARAAD